MAASESLVGSPVKKSKKRERKENDDPPQSSLEEKTLKKEKKRKEKKIPDTERMDEDIPPNHDDETPKSKKKRKRDVGIDEAPDAVDPPKSTKRKSKVKTPPQTAPLPENDEEQLSLEKPPRKRKRGPDEPEILTPTAVDTPEKPEKAKKKKHKNRTNFSDPDEDASLPEQSKKCLAYAFLQFNRPKKWKFSKARQNWLIRNLWSTEMIPDAHLPLLVEYLAKVQGGVRENLIKVCQANVEEPPKKENEPSPAASEPTKVTDTIKGLRAQQILSALGSSETIPIPS